MAGRASAIRSAPSSPTSSPAVRYWNRARQRYHRLSARYSRACVSLPTQAARPGPDNRGKPRLLDLERRIPARDRFAPDSPLEGTGFEPPVPPVLTFSHRALAEAGSPATIGFLAGLFGR